MVGSPFINEWCVKLLEIMNVSGIDEKEKEYLLHQMPTEVLHKNY